MSRSPLQKALDRRRLQKRSSLAMARALKQGATLLPVGSARKRLIAIGRRVEACSVTSQTRIVTKPGEASFIAASNRRACHFRGCMTCEAKRASAVARLAIDDLEHILAQAPGARVLMLTLTSRNRVIKEDAGRPFGQAREMLLAHQAATKTFFAYRRMQTSILGHLTNIEIDFSILNGELFAHVHSHSALVVERGALSDHRYLPQRVLVGLWQRALRADYKPIVDIRAVTGRDRQKPEKEAIRAAIREVCKYCLDTEGFFFHDNGIVLADPRAAVAFALAVYRRRLTSMDRIFLDARKHRMRASRESPTQQNPEHASDPRSGAAGF